MLWDAVGEAIEAYSRDVGHLSAGGIPDVDEVRKTLDRFDFERPLPPLEAVSYVIDALRHLQPQVSHPRHFGLFDPSPTALGVLGEALAAAFNPCLASWEGSPFGVEAEDFLVRQFAQRFGYPAEAADGIVTSGGSEANLSALMLALTRRFPQHREDGLGGLAGRPVLYVTREAHPSSRKAALVAGLGMGSVREVPTDHMDRMDAAALGEMVDADVCAGLVPLMVVATVGTTGSGVVDPIDDVADVADRRGVWLHADAAWGGAVTLLPELRGELKGIHRADSITFDPHKWLSIPMGCGLLLTRHSGLLDRAFGVGAAFLTGQDGPVLRDQDGPAPDPYGRSVRWSRNFAGLKLLLSLAVAGWRGYEEALRRQVQLGQRLRERLAADRWALVNDTPLPVVCFVGDPAEHRHARLALDAMAQAVNASGQARVFVVRVGDRFALRACVTNYATTDADIDLLVQALSRARSAVAMGRDTGRMPTSMAERGGGCCGAS